MKRFFQIGAAVAILSCSVWVGQAQAEDHGEAHGAHEGHAEEAGADHAEHGAHHTPHFSDINWFTGLVGEKEGVEPSLIWRAPGTPVPLGALLINTAILFFLLGRFGGPAIKSGLKSRKEQIAGDIERAAKMKAEAEEQLAHYEGKLSEMQAEMERIKTEMRAQAENERQRITEDAKARAAALEAEARLMVQQQLAHARDEAIRKAVSGAVEVAREEIKKNLTAQDQDRLAKGLLSGLESHLKNREVRS